MGGNSNRIPFEYVSRVIATQTCLLASVCLCAYILCMNIEQKIPFSLIILHNTIFTILVYLICSYGVLVLEGGMR
jgi:hypothetical protein